MYRVFYFQLIFVTVFSRWITATMPEKLKQDLLETRQPAKKRKPPTDEEPASKKRKIDPEPTNKTNAAKLGRQQSVRERA